MNDKEKELAFEYSWRWFQHHAQQRYSSFNYYLIIMGALSYGYISFKDADGLLKIVISILGVIISFAFLIIERRNSELVDDGREALDKLEAEEGPFKYYSIRKLDKERRNESGACDLWFTHAFAFKLVIIVFMFLSLMALVQAIISNQMSYINFIADIIIALVLTFILSVIVLCSLGRERKRILRPDKT